MRWKFGIGNVIVTNSIRQDSIEVPCFDIAVVINRWQKAGTYNYRLMYLDGCSVLHSKLHVDRCFKRIDWNREVFDLFGINGRKNES